jgi:hypothetical protein
MWNDRALVASAIGFRSGSTAMLPADPETPVWRRLVDRSYGNDGAMSESAASRPTSAPPRPAPPGDGYDGSIAASPFDKIAYLFALVGLYVMVGGLFFYGFWEKAVDGNFDIAPPLKEQFDKTFIGTIPGQTRPGRSSRSSKASCSCWCWRACSRWSFGRPSASRSS